MRASDDTGIRETISVSTVLVPSQASPRPSIDTHTTRIQNPTTPAHTTFVQHVSVAVAGSHGDSRAAAHATDVRHRAAVGHAVAPRTARAVPSAYTACICDVSCAVALAREDARAAADPALVQHVSVAIAGARGDSISVAHTTEVNGPTAVCDAVTPCAARAVPSTNTACICDVSCAVALVREDSRAAADPALVQHISVAVAGARGDPASVAHATDVRDRAAVGHTVAPRTAQAVPSAYTACICDVSCAVALAREDARAAAEAALIDRVTIAIAPVRWKSRAVAHATDVKDFATVGLAVTANGHLNDGRSNTK